MLLLELLWLVLSTGQERKEIKLKSKKFTEHLFNGIRGDELGYFAFGGSTVIVLFKKDTIKFDNDLVVNSKKPIETLVHVRFIGYCSNW